MSDETPIKESLLSIALQGKQDEIRNLRSALNVAIQIIDGKIAFERHGGSLTLSNNAIGYVKFIAAGMTGAVEHEGADE